MRLAVIEENTGFITADDQGRQYFYAHEGFSEVTPDVPAIIWLENKGVIIVGIVKQAIRYGST